MIHKHPAKRVISTLTYGLLALLGAVSVLLPKQLTPQTNFAASPPEAIRLSGAVHDFPRAHADFDVIPSGGFGHYAGNVNDWLSGGRYPVFVSGAGFKVDDQWRDSASRPIAPHGGGVQGGIKRQMLGFRVSQEITFEDDSSMDAFNSVFGSYGFLGNFGSKAFVSTNSGAAGAVTLEAGAYLLADVATGQGSNPTTVIAGPGTIAGDSSALDEPYEMPDLDLPDYLESYVVTYDITGNVTLTGDVTPDDDNEEPALHFGTLRIKDDATVTIDGDLQIRCDKSLLIDRAEIVLLPDANLSIYVSRVAGGTGDVTIRESVINTEPGDSTLVTINALGTGKLEIKKSHVAATVVAPDRELTIDDDGHLYGAFIGRSTLVKRNGSGLHVDSSNAIPTAENFAFSVREKIEIDDDCIVDSFDSSVGPYGGANIGSSAWVSTNAYDKSDQVKVKNDSTINGTVLIGPNGDIDKVVDVDGDSTVTGGVGMLPAPRSVPVVTPPSLGASVGDREYVSGIHFLSSDLRCKKLKLDSGAILKIIGERRVRVDDKVEMKDGSKIELEPGATLELYVKKDMKLEKNCEVNMNTGDPRRVSIRRISLGKKGKVELKDGSRMCAWIQGAKTELKLDDESELFGTFIGRKASVKKKSKFHVDMVGLQACVAVDDTAGTRGVDSSGGITSTATFGEWYRSVLGVNQSGAHQITLTKNVSGDWEYLDSEFYPIDDELLGNEGDPHNYFFTYMLPSKFTYTECGNQFVEFEGGDGAWLFINRQLALDLGGVTSGERQFMELDRLGLEGGQEYEFHLFFAQRRAGSSVFRLRTNLELSTESMIPNVTAAYD